MKKIVCMAIIICMFFTLGVYGRENVNAAENDFKTDLLTALNITEGNSKETYVTRAEFARMVYNLANMNDVGIRIETISDMHRDHPEIVYISNIVGVGWMSLDENKCFRPDEKMTGTEMLKVLLCVLGYYDVAIKDGGYPAGVLTYAVKSGLVKNIAADFSGVLSRKQVCDLLSNALEIDMMERKYIVGQECYEIASGKNLLKENHNITEHAIGRYTANSRFNLGVTSTVTPKKTVKIGENVFYVGKYADQLIPGCFYKVYSAYKAHDDPFETIIFIKNISESDVITVNSVDIADSTTISRFVYRKNKNGESYIKKVDLNNVDVIFNGEELFTYKKEDLMPSVGEVSLIFEGKVCKTVIISSYDTKIVKNTSEVFEKIYFDYSGGAVDVSDKEFDIYYENNAIDFKELQSGDVALVAYTKSGVVNEIIVTRGFSEGTIDAIDSEGRYCIGDNEYILSPHLYDDNENCNIGSKILFYQDFYGNIARIKKVEPENYAFLVAGENSSGVSDDFKLKLLSAGGELGVYSVNDKTLLNGIKVGADKILESLTQADGSPEYQLLKIKYNSNNVLNSIEIAVDNKQGGYIPDFSKDLTTSSSQWRYLNGFLSDGDTVYYIKNDIPVFSVFVDETGDIYEESVLVNNVDTEFINFRVYNDVVLYDVDEKENAPQAIVNYLNAEKYVTAVTNQKGLIVIDSVGKVITADGEVLDNLHYYLNGLRYEIAVSENVKNVAALNSATYDVPDIYENVKFSDLKQGDAIQINIDYKGQLSSFIPAFVQSVATEYGKLIDYNNQGYAQFSNYETLYGMLEEQTENIIKVNVNGNAQLFIQGTPVVYLYEKGRNTVTVISGDELYNYLDYPMFFHFYRKTVQNIVIYSL